MRKWEKEEIEFLKDNYKKFSDKELAKKLNRTLQAVGAKRIRIGNKRNRKWTKKETIEELKKINKNLGFSPYQSEVPQNLLGACYRNFKTFNNAKKIARLSIRESHCGFRRILNKNYKKLTIEKSYILGVSFGDGYSFEKGYSLGLFTIDEEFALKFSDCLNKQYGFNTKIRYDKNKKGFFVEKGSRLMCEDLLKYGSNKTKKWRIPNDIFKSNKKMIFNFLRGLYDSDGSVNPQSAHIHFHSSNKNGLKDVHNLLKKIKIKSQIYSNETNSNEGNVGITNKIYKKLFLDNVGFTIKRKQERLKNILGRMSI